MLTGCLSFIPVSKQTIREIPDDFKCEYRIGKNAKTSKTTVDTDVVFDKEIPEDMAKYWRPILEKIREDAAKEADDDL